MIPAEGNYTLSIFSPGYTPISIDTPLSFGENDFSYSLNLSTLPQLRFRLPTAVEEEALDMFLPQQMPLFHQ